MMMMGHFNSPERLSRSNENRPPGIVGYDVIYEFEKIFNGPDGQALGTGFYTHHA